MIESISTSLFSLRRRSKLGRNTQRHTEGNEMKWNSFRIEWKKGASFFFFNSIDFEKETEGKEEEMEREKYESPLRLFERAPKMKQVTVE